MKKTKFEIISALALALWIAATTWRVSNQAGLIEKLEARCEALEVGHAEHTALLLRQLMLSRPVGPVRIPHLPPRKETP